MPRSAVSLLLVACGCGGAEGEPSRPGAYAPHAVLGLETVVDADGARDIADPHVVRHGGTWYLYATQTKRDLHVWTSDDLATWTRHGPVWRPTPGTWNARGQVWAPHVERMGDEWLMYYTAGLMIGVARASSPLGPFEEVHDHPLIGGGHGGVGDGVFESGPPDDPAEWQAAFLLDFPEMAIDAFLLRASNGSLWMYFSAYLPVSAIHVVPMADPVTVAPGAVPARLLVPEGWEGLVTEAAFVVERGGRFHLTYSGNAADTAGYAVGGAAATAPDGPFERYAENPILFGDAAAGFFGPGHHGLCEGAFGDVLMFYHTKVSAAKGFDRRIRYVPVAFDADGLLRLSVPAP
ncbi:MAG: family 43 glycosylhydrolase [Deltaproteobacteria bacterium]|nr:family 43 glycosylhydrolase [Deltaproteobacteria bacterium]